MKVIKFKKYKDGYKDGMQGTTPRYPLEIEAFFESQCMGHTAEHGGSAVEVRTSPSAPSSSVAPPKTGLLSDSPTVGTSTRGAPEGRRGSSNSTF